MPTRSPGRTRASRRSPSQGLSLLKWLLVFSPLLGTGCGAPGEPAPPSPQIPAAINDLGAHQVGDTVELTFSVPSKSTLGERLKETPTMEILRGGLNPDGLPDPKSFRVADTIPGSLVSNYQQRNKVFFLDPVPPEDVRNDKGKSIVYHVRARVSNKRTSPNSNDVTVSLYPVPEHLSSLDARLTENGIELRWSPPTRTSGGEPLPKVDEYHVYRGELDPASADKATQDPQKAVWKHPPLEIGETQATEYVDSAVDNGRIYGYVMRSAIYAGGALLESGDSNLKIVVARDTFPPAAPQGLVAALSPGEGGKPVVDLSWSLNVEPDLEGYRVYRSEQEGSRGLLLTPEQLPTPAYRDISAQPGKGYWYTVTAMDRAGNESAPSSPVSVEIPQPSR